jgi:hypothetical protein
LAALGSWKLLTITTGAHTAPCTRLKVGDVVYALHAFQKKSARGIATPKAEIALIKQRLKEAYIHYEQEIGDSK